MSTDGWRFEVRDPLGRVPARRELGLLASWCFNVRERAGQVAAVVGWVAHVTVDEWGFRAVKLRGADIEVLRQLRHLAAENPGSTKLESPWSPPIRRVWKPLHVAVVAEMDRQRFLLANLEAGFDDAAARVVPDRVEDDCPGDGWRHQMRAALGRAPLMTGGYEDELERLALSCFDLAKASAGQVEAAVNSVGHAALEERGWRAVKLQDASIDELQSLRIITAVHRGGPEWPQRVEGEGRHQHEQRVADLNPSPGLAWSPEVRDVWAEALDAVCAEGDRRNDELDDVDASWRLLAQVPR